MKKLKLFFACLLMAVLSIGQVWGDSYTITLKSGTGSSDSSSGMTSTTVADYVADGASYVSAVAPSGKVYLAKSECGIKFGNSSGGGSLTFTLATAVKPTSIVVNASQFGASEGTGIFQGQNFDMTGGGGKYSFNNYTVEYDGNTEVTTISVGCQKRGYVKSITVNYGGSTPPTPTCAAPTFDPEDGETFTDNIDVEIAAESGTTIYYTTDGEDPTTSSDVYTTALNFTETTTLKAIATKTGSNNSAVATATYTKVEAFDGLKLDFVLSANNLSLPTAKGSSVAGNYTYTIGTTDYTFYATDAQGSNDGGIYFGGSYTMIYANNALGLPAISGYKLVKLEASNSSGCSTTTAVSIREGQTSSDDIVSGGTAQTWGTQSSMYTYNLTGTEENTMYYLYVTTKNCQLTGLSLYYEEVETPLLPKAAKPTFESGDENFVTSTSVTLACTTVGAKIYYTTNGDEPTTSSTLYEGAIPVSTTTTIKAIAVADGYDKSATAEKTFTQVEALQSLTALLEATTSTETGYNVVISDWVVTGAISNRAWISNAENTKGILLYKSGHGFTAGKKLNGVVIGTKAKLFQGYPELTSLVSTEVTVSDAAEITPRTTTLAALVSGYNVEQGTLVKLENVTYAAGTGFSDGSNTVALSTQLYGPTMVDGATYNIIGVVRYDNGPVYSIMPRSVNDVEQISGGGLPEVDGLAELKGEATGASYLVNLTNAVVTLVSGNNAFIEDATAGALIFYSGHGLVAGDKLNGQYEVTTATYQGKFEITAMTAQTGAEKTSGAEIPETTLTIAQLNENFAANESKRIKIVGANVTDAISGSDRNGAINDGAALAVYAGVTNTITLTVNDNVDIIGYPGFHNTDEQLTVWAQADITVNVKEDPELAFDPVSETITGGDAWSAPAFANPHTLDVTFESDNEAVATVSNTGVVALEGGYGTAVITAHTDGDATYAAGNATYTITVNDPGAAPVYTMSFNMTRASYDAAADAEVVWNSSVVTFTADKNDGTKVTNYLAGNYSGTTLIEEVRFYAKNSLSFVPASGVTITKVEWMSTAKGYATKLAAETWTNATVAVDATNDKLVIITPSAAGEFSVTLTDAARATGITVYYQADAEKDKLTASIAIDDMNMAVGDDDILLSAIAATSNPNKKAISYAVTDGTAVSIVGEGAEAALHAVAEGTATITATIPDNLGNYTGATKTFTVTVAAGPATLESIAISGTASNLEYTEGQTFNPVGLVVTGHYSDNSDAEITTGITWTFDPSPLTAGTTSVSVTATVGNISSDAVVVNGLTVSAAAAPTSGNVVILAEYDSKFYAMTNSLASGALAGVEVEKDGSKIVVSSAEDKVAIQWTATVDGNNTTLKDANDKYIKGSNGASLSLDDAAYNWNWDGEKSCYISSAYTTRGLFFSNSGNVFKGYALENIVKAGYAATEVIEIDPEDIVISSKVDPELAYTPASDEITVGDAWSAPALGYVEGFDGLAAISYESSDEAVATVSDAGVIVLAGGIGTATITATFGGNASYLAGSATYTVKVNEPAEDCDGSDDFITATNTSASSYNVERTTTNGWSSVNSALTTINSEARWLTMLGKTSQVGVITSPTLNDGIASLKIRYANTFSESNGVSFRVDIKQGEDVVKTFTVTKANSEVTQGTVYTETIEDINVAGEFQIIFTNLCPSAANSNKDRVSIGKLCWENYSAPEPPTKDLVRDGLSNGKWGTLCPKQTVENVEGATFYQISYLEEQGGMPYNMVFDEISGTTLTAGQPYFFIANATEIRGNKTGDAVDAAGAAVNGFYGWISPTGESLALTDWHAEYTPSSNNNTYVIYNNMVTRINGPTNLKSERCYININSTEPSRTAVPKNNARRRITMNVQNTNAATGFENLKASEKPVKLMIDGQIFILRGEKLYDATGRLVK